MTSQRELQTEGLYPDSSFLVPVLRECLLESASKKAALSFMAPIPTPTLDQLNQCLTSHVDQSTITRSETCSSCETDNIIRSKRQAEDVEVISVYITIEGSVDGSTFSVISKEGRSLVGEGGITSCRNTTNI